eukprot:gene55153-21679_t
MGMDGFPGPVLCRNKWAAPKGFPKQLNAAMGKNHLLPSKEVEEGSCRAYGRQEGFAKGYSPFMVIDTTTNINNVGGGVGMKGGF